MTISKLIIVLCCLSFTPAMLSAAPIDGAIPLLCAMQQAQECGSDSADCQTRRLEDVNLPAFIRINLAQNEMIAIGAEERKAAVRHVGNHERFLVMQGGQETLGWSLVIAKETGSLSATVVSDGVGFVLFGTCIPAAS